MMEKLKNFHIRPGMLLFIIGIALFAFACLFYQEKKMDYLNDRETLTREIQENRARTDTDDRLRPFIVEKGDGRTDTNVEAMASESARIQQLYESAEIAADEIARLQNEYVTIAYADWSSDESAAYVERLTDIRTRLKTYFPYQAAFTETWLSWGEENDLSWESVCAKDYDLDDDCVPVVWLCRDDYGNIYAYAFGAYDPVSDTFADYKKGVTNYGLHSVPYTEGSDFDNPGLRDDRIVDDRELDEFVASVFALAEETVNLPETDPAREGG